MARKVVVSEFITLDGVIEHPAWTFDYDSDERGQFKDEELKAADCLLLGRVTYEGMSVAWPQMAEQTGEYGERMNGYPKYVPSTTLAQAEMTWNANRIEGDLATAINELKGQAGRDILVFGSGKLVESLIRDDLVDEFRLMVFPIVLGAGQRLFTDGLKTTLELAEVKPLPAGVVILTYRRAAQAEATA
jgi:dihydrofolate reductase